MLILGLIAILQVIFIPGYILVNVFKIKTNTPIQKWIYAFAISLFTNYNLVTILVLFSIYTSITLWIIIIIEILILFIQHKTGFSILYRKELLIKGGQNNSDGMFHFFSGINFRKVFNKFSETLNDNHTFNKIIIITSAIIFLFYFSLFFANIGTIFYFNDVINWNGWAKTFAKNILPLEISHYPQLLSANWSISYVMTGTTEIQLFNKVIMPLFYINNLLIFIDLTYRKNNIVFLTGLIIYELFAPIIFSLVFIADGNADIAVSFFVFLTFYSFINNFSFVRSQKSLIKNDESDKLNFNFNKVEDYTIIILFSSIAIATKVAGFYSFAITIFILFIILMINRKKLETREIFKIIVFAILINIINLFWYYIMSEYGLDENEFLPYSYLERFIRAIKLMYYNFGLPVFAFFIITIFASLFHKMEHPDGTFRSYRNPIGKVRYISFIMVIVPTVIWMFQYSVDFRNLSFVIPFLSFCSAASLLTIIQWMSKPNLSEKANGDFLSSEKSDLILNTNSRQNSEALSLQNGDEPFSTSESLGKRGKIFLLLTIIISTVMLLIFISDWFYIFLLNIYEFIHKYYFQSYRIAYFIEDGFLLHTDFYQRTFIVFAIILIVCSIIILFKIKFNQIVLAFVTGLIILNFTIMKEENLIQQQKESLERVDARNSYALIEMIIENLVRSDKIGTRRIKNVGLNEVVHTNFWAITKDKIPREVKFNYINNFSITRLEEIKGKINKLDDYQLVFLRWDLTDSATRNFIKEKIKNKEYKVLLDYYEYIFLKIE